MRGIIHKIIGCLLLACIAFPAQAQDIIQVSGKVLNNQPDERKLQPFPEDEKVTIRAYHTIEAAQEAYRHLNDKDTIIQHDGEVTADSNGYYEIRVAETGALIIQACTESKMVEVKGNRVIDVSFEIPILPSISVVGVMMQPRIFKEPTFYELGKRMFSNEIYFPKHVLGERKRLIVRSFLLDCNKEDTVVFFDPIVIDGKKYIPPRKRLPNGKKGDPLEAYVDHRRTFGKEDFSLWISNVVRVPNPSASYQVHAKVTIEDHTHTTYEKVMVLSDCRTKRLFRFLEIPKFDFQLNPDEYKEKPRRERRNIRMAFTATTDSAALKSLIQEENTTLKELQIISIASPDGNYTRNLKLAEQRYEKAAKWIENQIEKNRFKRIFIPKADIRVASWEEMATLLEKDSLLQEAEEIRSIVKENASQDAQYAQIRKLPYYGSTIKERLPLLRKLQYDFKYEIFRELKPDEIVDRYYNEPEYRDGKKRFTRYEYWHLFQHIKDEKETEKIYRRAYEETLDNNAKGEKEPWMLAANNLASALLKRDTFDVEILKPLINDNLPVNAQNKSNDGISINEMTINPEDVVANQVLMYIHAKQYWHAKGLAEKLPDTDKFKLLKALTYCLDGDFDYRNASNMYEAKERKAMFELIRNSSPMNNAVMCMAMETDFYNAEARKVLETMPQTTQVKYMKLQLFIRENKLHDDPLLAEPFSKEEMAFKDACSMLFAIIKEDPKFKNIAENDGELSREFIEFYSDPYNWEF